MSIGQDNSLGPSLISTKMCRDQFCLSRIHTTNWCPLFIVFLVIAPGEHISIKRGQIWLLLWWDERGDQLVSQCIVGLCSMLFIRPLLLIFAHCHFVFALCCLATPSSLSWFSVHSSFFFALWHLANDSCHLSMFCLLLLCTTLYFFAQMLLAGGSLHFLVVSLCWVIGFWAISSRGSACQCFWVLDLNSWVLEVPCSVLVLNLVWESWIGSDKLENTWGN